MCGLECVDTTLRYSGRLYIKLQTTAVPQTMIAKSRQRLQIPIDLLRNCACLDVSTTGYYWGHTFKETERELECD